MKTILTITFSFSMLGLVVLVVGWLYCVDEAQDQWLPASSFYLTGTEPISNKVQARNPMRTPSPEDGTLDDNNDEIGEIYFGSDQPGDFVVELPLDLPEDFQGPGGCFDKKSCTEYCSQEENREECNNFQAQ